MGGSRPDGVAALSLIEVVGGAGTIVIGAYFLNAVDSIAASVGLGLANVPDFATFFAAEVVAGALAIVAGYALWTKKAWGWTLAIYLGVGVLVFAVGMGAYFLATYGDFTETEAMLLPMAVSLGAVYYLDRPVAKGFFGKY
jgi:peptidoglycan/LPS O-acetylase OafA/YrhL